jgi:hypothetical protein
MSRKTPVTLPPGHGQAGGVATLYGVTFQINGDNRDGLRGLLRRLQGGWPACEDNRHRQLHQLGGEGGKALGIPGGKALLDRKILARYVADILQPVQKRLHKRSLRRPKPQDADTWR